MMVATAFRAQIVRIWQRSPSHQATPVGAPAGFLVLRGSRNLISSGVVFFATLTQGKESPVSRLWIVLIIVAVLAGAAPAAAQQEPAPAPVDQGNGNWDPRRSPSQPPSADDRRNGGWPGSYSRCLFQR